MLKDGECNRKKKKYIRVRIGDVRVQGRQVIILNRVIHWGSLFEKVTFEQRFE